jgi:AraC-like DNA-binding protein
MPLKIDIFNLMISYETSMLIQSVQARHNFGMRRTYDHNEKNRYYHMKQFSAKTIKYLNEVIDTYEKSNSNRINISYLLLLPHIAAVLVIIYVFFKLYSSYRKRDRLNQHLIEYVRSVQNIQRPLDMLIEPLNDISVNTKLDDFQRDRIRVAIWRLNTIQNSIKSLHNFEKDIEWQNNYLKLKKKKSYALDKERAFTDFPDEGLQPNTDAINENDQSFLDKVFLIIRENFYDTEFNVDKLSQKIGMSRSSFYNRIKGISGQAPADFIRQYRMERAKELLKLNKYTIAEVAYKSGFSDVKYFRDVFKKKYNKSPGQFIKSN